MKCQYAILIRKYKISNPKCEMSVHNINKELQNKILQKEGHF